MKIPHEEITPEMRDLGKELLRELVPEAARRHRKNRRRRSALRKAGKEAFYALTLIIFGVIVGYLVTIKHLAL